MQLHRFISLELTVYTDSEYEQDGSINNSSGGIDFLAVEADIFNRSLL